MVSVGDGSKYDIALKVFSEYLRIFPAWAATMLSLKRAAPCLPAVYTLAIIDEASQCDIPPMIPVLYRAQRIAIVGDPNQFPPVITLKKGRDISDVQMVLPTILIASFTITVCVFVVRQVGMGSRQ